MPDPAELPPLCGKPEFAAILDAMVAGEAPRLFAGVQEYGERVDGQIVAGARPSATAPKSSRSDARSG
ncbi:hypothetical protein [Amycolatopsis benzoatilytica]|uniref:hypothetical protein n=1 Tax=Amycolatopsis benzoatilytica TaxID=346045 RepID=UPI0003775497|nr:hypothetical protein [Amycolatopsis benzoatilytica]